MTPLRKTALVAGVFYLLTFVSIPTVALYSAVRDPKYITGPGPDTAVFVGALLEIVVALACVGTAVVLFPVLKHQSEAFALGFVASRILEAGTILAGVTFLLTVVSLRQAGAGPDAVVTGRALIALYDRMFLVGQSFFPAVNAVLLGYLLYQTRLVPRLLPIVAFVGAPLLLGSDVAVLFGAIGRTSAPAGLAALPIALWELALGVWLVVKGFRPGPFLSALA